MAAKKKEKEKEKKTKLVVEEVVDESTDLKGKEEEKSKEEPKEEQEEQKEETSKEQTENKEKEDGKEEEIKEIVESKVTIKQVLMIAVPTAIVVAALTGGILFYINNSKVSDNKVNKKTSTLTPQQTTTPSPTPTLERSDLTVKVLNGSGTKGVAGEAQTFLEGLGYEGVETGNASSYDFEETVVSIKKDKKEYLDMIVKDLSEKYKVSSESATLNEDSDFDVEITVGKS